MSKPITNKEKIICRLLVSKYDKPTLESELQNSIYNLGESKYVQNAYKYLGIPLSRLNSILGSQYLNYSVENFEDIKNKVLPTNIERTVIFDFQASEVKKVRVIESYELQVYGLLSKEKYIKQDVIDNFFDYDPISIMRDSDDDDEDETIDVVLSDISENINNVIE